MKTQTAIEDLTPKAKQTRETILKTAIDLFVQKGYDDTTMRDIAAASGCSLGLAYRYYPSKSHLVLSLYDQIAQEFEEHVDDLPAGTLAERFEAAMKLKFELLQPYRAAFGAIIGVILSPDSGVAVLGEEAKETRTFAIRSFAKVVLGSKDAPKQPQLDQMTDLFYAGHLLMLLFWTTDRTPNMKATYSLLSVSKEVLAFVRPMLRLPQVSRMLTRITQAMSPVFGGMTRPDEG
jgi:AcrR family transcriptional regulator